ncbi:molybdate ABC transporter substrate-binding protein [Pararhizobium mangrovi]|uniref:ABC transporter substrate-binding protein n=1 Tax=Pararhizobium mangrovi TaxID=2590452 RepID=A0A506UB05_9HYPH|nr:substrate-binding domain-containing protein [Pararhizobium mangrovi]TPW28987.1 ABC transporter substrate-binding protein [Pararhizobium mangrovi]
MTIRLLSGGAANGLVSTIEPDFLAETGMGITGEFGPVGIMRDRVEKGEHVDVLVLTRKIIDQFAADGVVRSQSVQDVGSVATSIAVRDGAESVDVSTPDALRTALLAASAIYFPDPEKATAGIHFAGVLSKLGIDGEVADRLELHPSGQHAMAAMAAEGDARSIGCTQVTEILNTEGVRYVDELPEGCDLKTTYTAAVCTRSEAMREAERLVSMLTGPENESRRSEAGFK